VAGILKTSLDLPIGWDVVILILALFAIVALVFTGRNRESVYRRFEKVDRIVENRKKMRREIERRGDRADHTGYASASASLVEAAGTAPPVAQELPPHGSSQGPVLQTRKQVRRDEIQEVVRDYTPAVSVLHWGWALMLSLTLSLVGILTLVTVVMDSIG
jgi:FtsZ-interacting cell division protein ZipA